MKQIVYLLFLSLLFIGCPVEVVMPSDGGITDAGIMDAKIKDAGIQDAKKDVKNPEAGLDFDMWPPTTGDIKYHNGPLMTAPVPVYLLWYGDWNNNTAVKIIEDLIVDLSESPYFSITSSYYEMIAIDSIPKLANLNKTYAASKISLAKSVFVGYTNGTILADADVFNVIKKSIDTQLVPNDSTAIYLVLTSSDVRQGSFFSGFCSSYCGWHDHKTYNSIDIKYGFIGDPTDCLDSCTAKNKYEEYGIDHTPNLNWGADGMASVIAHELTEIITDPDWRTAPGWADDIGYENADKCAWNYGSVYLTDGGSVANVKLGNREFLLQQNWLLDEDAGQHCALHP